MVAMKNEEEGRDEDEGMKWFHVAGWPYPSPVTLFAPFCHCLSVAC
jgi:hypothetical protein